MSNVYGGGFAALKGYEAGEDGGKERRRAAVRSVSTKVGCFLLQSTKREMILTNQTEGR